MRRVKTKLPEDLESALRGLAGLRRVTMQDYCRQVVDIFVHGALETTRRAKVGIPGIDMEPDHHHSQLGKCEEELVLLLSDNIDFDTVGKVHSLALLNSITASEVLRNILGIHVYGSAHVVSMRMPVLPGQGKRGEHSHG